MLEVSVEKQLGEFRIAAQFRTPTGATALFGPSGAGKTSIINMIAGLLRPDKGRIALGGDTLFDSTTGVHMPAHRRRIGYVFQEGRLFPHISVRRNIAYGRWMNGIARDAGEEERLIAMLNLAALLQRRPGKLSGGERQRVAIARALLTRPRLLLLDEPLASLDAGRKEEILPYLERLRDSAGVPIIYVSHHAEEIRRIATTVVRIESGRSGAIGGLELLGAHSSFTNPSAPFG